MHPRSFSQTLRYTGEAAAFFLFMGFFRLLGVDAASALGGFIGRHVFSRTRLTQRARDNLAAAFPDKSPGEINTILARMWDNLGRVVAEYAHLDKFDATRITVHGADHATAARGHGALILSGHLANWEIMPVTAAQHGLDGAIVYRPPNNPFVDRYIARMRARRGYREQISKHNGAKRIFTLLRGGKFILLLADQKTNEGIEASFFGRDAMTTPVPAALALKLRVPIMMASNRRTRGAHFAVTLHAPFMVTPSGDDRADVLAVTQAINDRLEAMVREDPAQWLWIHRRWPTAKDLAKKAKAAPA